MYRLEEMKMHDLGRQAIGCPCFSQPQLASAAAEKGGRQAGILTNTQHAAQREH